MVRTKEEKRVYDRKYNRRNKTKIKERRQGKEKKPITQKQREYNREYHKKRYNNDIQYKIRVRLSNNFNMALRRYNKLNLISKERSKKIDYKAIIEHLKPFPKNISEYNIDHVIPLDFFDLTDSEQIKKAWESINIQWLKCSDNIIKSNIIDFGKFPKQEYVFNKLNLEVYI